MSAAPLQNRLQQPRWLRLAVNQANRGMTLETVIPTQQIVLSTMRRQATDGVDRRLYRHGRAVDVDPARMVDEGSTKRAGCLIARENDVTFGTRQIVG
jgi:hypothetical protein